MAALVLGAAPLANANQLEGEETETTEWESGVEEVDAVDAGVVVEVAPSESGAMPAAGTIGIGTVGTLNGTRGAEIEYYMDGFMLEAVLGFSFASPDGSDSLFGFGLGLGGFYPLASGGGSALMLGGRLMTTFAKAGETQFQFDVEVPLRGQLWLGKHFALHAEAGLVVNIVTEDFSPVDGLPKGIFANLGSQGGVLGRMGATMYF